MAKKLLTKPRKRATQQRSRATVDVLIQATTRILINEGFDKANTNRIAEVAGVSIGSLYQYFPGKDALVAAVIDLHNQQLAQTVRAALAEAESLAFDRGIRRIVTAAVEAHCIAPQLHRVLAEQMPRLERLQHAEAINHDAQSMFREYLEEHRADIHTHDLELAAFVCGTAIEALSHHAVLHHPGAFAHPRMEILIDETTRLVVGYLQGSSGQSGCEIENQI